MKIANRTLWCVAFAALLLAGARHIRTSYYCEICGERRVDDRRELFGLVYSNSSKISETEYSRLYAFAISRSCSHKWHFLGSRTWEPWMRGVEIGEGRYQSDVLLYDFLLRRLRCFDRARIATVLAALSLSNRQSSSQLDREDSILDEYDAD